MTLQKIKTLVENISLALLTIPTNKGGIDCSLDEYDSSQTLENYLGKKVIFYQEWLDDQKNTLLIEEYQNSNDKYDKEEILVILMEPIFNMFPFLEHSHTVEHHEIFEQIVHKFIITM